MAERALPQASRKNVLRVFADLLRPPPDARESFSTAALAQAGYGQGRHAHALLTFLGFLDGDQPTQDVRLRRKDSRDFAAWLHRAVSNSYAPRLGDMNFLFDETNQETVRSLAKGRVEQASQAATRPLLKRNIAQVVDCLLAVREVYRQLQSGRREWIAKALPDDAEGRGQETSDTAKPLDSPSLRVASIPGDDGWSTRQSEEDGQANPCADNDPQAVVDDLQPGDLVARLAGRLSSSTRRITFHAKHVQIDDAGHTHLTLDDVDITIN